MRSRWRADHRSKEFGEKFAFLYSTIWISFLAIVVFFKWYEFFTPSDYLMVGLGLALPYVVGPLVLARGEERRLPLTQRYIMKANLFVAILSYIGNHFYTHYFFNVLGVRYTGPLAQGMGFEINKVPISMFLMTHVYFMSYHILITPLIRTLKNTFRSCGATVQFVVTTIGIVVMAFFTAVAETWTISSFPYYTYPNTSEMLTKGSVFYGTYFVVTFPWFFRLDEDTKHPWRLSRVVVEALASMMVVLLCADFWRLILEYFKSLPSQRLPYA